MSMPETTSPGGGKSTVFSATSERRDRTLAATLAGTADLTVKGRLDDFLSALHETARTHVASEVVMDFTALTFMNSSCLKAFVTWICTVQDLPAPTQYRIVLVSSPSTPWQQRSLHALSCLAPELVTLRS